jgi:hypothetical protein
LTNGGGTNEFAHTLAWQERKSPSGHYRQWNCEHSWDTTRHFSFQLLLLWIDKCSRIVRHRDVSMFSQRLVTNFSPLYVKCNCFLSFLHWCLCIVFWIRRKCVNHDKLPSSTVQSNLFFHLRLMLLLVEFYRDWCSVESFLEICYKLSQNPSFSVSWHLNFQSSIEENQSLLQAKGSQLFLLKVLYHLVPAFPFSGTVSPHMGDRLSHESGVRKRSSSKMLHHCCFEGIPFPGIVSPPINGGRQDRG